MSRTLRSATIATLPRWMREIAGLRQSRLEDVLIVPVMKVAFGAAALNPRLELQLLRRLSPSTVPVAGLVLFDLAPVNPETTTPSLARERLGLPKPSEAHREFRARQRARLFDEGVAPSDEGIIESEPILGSIA